MKLTQEERARIWDACAPGWSGEVLDAVDEVLEARGEKTTDFWLERGWLDCCDWITSSADHPGMYEAGEKARLHAQQAKAEKETL